MDQNLPPDLLDASHAFPGVFRIKAIGSVDNDFEGRILGAVKAALDSPEALEFSVRKTADGRHVALTLDVTVQDAEHVRTIYARIREQEGILFLL